PTAAAERSGIHARGDHVFALRLAEPRTGRRRYSVSEAGIRDRTAVLRRRLAKRDVLERPRVLALLDRQVRPEQQRRDELVLHPLAVDLILDQLRQHSRALRVADEHDTAAGV